MASTSQKLRLRSNNNIHLIGTSSEKFSGRKLPSKREVLQCFFYQMREKKLSKRDSARSVIDDLFVIWSKARIPTRRAQQCIAELEALYERWRGIEKRTLKQSGSQRKKEEDFCNILDDLFDIAHANALLQIENEEDAKFLEMQRRKGRPGYMAGVDRELAEREEKIRKRDERREYLQEKQLDEEKKSSEFQKYIKYYLCKEQVTH
jgi:hypothetical protein